MISHAGKMAPVLIKKSLFAITTALPANRHHHAPFSVREPQRIPQIEQEPASQFSTNFASTPSSPVR